MFVLNKLKAVATGVVAGLVILAGLGLVAGPSVWAGPEEKPNRPTPAPAPAATREDPQRPPDDLVFLRRTSLDLRGTLPTQLEAHYFLADTDPKKRTKIVEWMLPEHGKQKATEHCLKCHKLPEGVPFLKDIPHLGRLFTKPGDPHYSGYFMGDFDGDGVLDVFVANQLRGAAAGESNNQAIAVRRANMEEARLHVEAARKKIDEIKRVTVPDSPVAKDLLGRAQADLTKAEAAYRAAEQQWKDATDHAESWRLRASLRQPNQFRIAQGLDRLLMEQWLTEKPPPTDAEFLRRVVTDLTGAPPTTVEERYFVADKDPKKREKLLGLLLGKGDKLTVRDKFIDDLLADPDVRKRLEQVWQRYFYTDQVNAAHEAWTNKPAGRLDRLLADLLEREKSDEQVLNALCLATLARFPTETELKLIVDAVKAQADRRTAWQGVLKALAATEEAKAHATELGNRGAR